MRHGKLAILGAAWLLVGFVVTIAVALATPRHSTATRVTALVWVLPIASVALGFLVRMLPELFDAPSFGALWRGAPDPPESPEPQKLDDALGYRPESGPLIETWRQKYLNDEIDLDQFEDGVARSLVGRASAATEAEAEAIRDARRVMPADVRRWHEREIERKLTM